MMEILLIMGIICVIISTYMLIRNSIVFKFRMKYLANDTYEQIPSYDYMMNKFWVWPMSRFLDE